MQKKQAVNKERFGARLKSLMEENNETTYTIAEAVTLSPATISRYTTGDSTAKSPAIEALARYFGVNPAWLMGYDVPKAFNFDPNNGDAYANSDNPSPTENRLRLLARKADNLTDVEKETLLRHFEESIDMYLEAKGIKRR